MKKNIVLIGMPGCGKTRVGEVLSRRLKMPLVDTDHLVETRTERSIPDIFARDGEAAFRDLETDAARAACEAGDRCVKRAAGAACGSASLAAG